MKSDYSSLIKLNLTSMKGNKTISNLDVVDTINDENDIYSYLNSRIYVSGKKLILSRKRLHRRCIGVVVDCDSFNGGELFIEVKQN